MTENMYRYEHDLENALIEKLQDLKYEYRPEIRNRATLEVNFRRKFEALNHVTLTDGEFQRLLNEIVTPDVYEASRFLRNRETFVRDDGTPLNYTLVNIKDWCKNTFEVVNQLRINTDYSHHQYDVILLINGIPVVQIEIKALGISPRRAMKQIVDYKNDLGNGYTKTLLCFVQLFIVSNRTNTWYFTNNNSKHFAFDADEQFLPICRFADQKNNPITCLDEFAEHFLAKCTLGQMISRYMVLIASEKKILMMRPYQIYAVKAIIDCIDQNAGNGYIWHTTGSGKTLTSFKASTLLKANENIHKCIFVVDRKDLDRQTREEFNRFQENCVEENTDTASLVRRLLSDNYTDKVIVTTIQKLGLALNENGKYSRESKFKRDSRFRERLSHLRDKRMVFIFDECHRSQFGENHRAIKEFFPNSQLFGFTGTPIFEDNASARHVNGDTATLRTTEDLFQKQLHAYTITDAIDDGNVLRFHVDYYKPESTSDSGPCQALSKQMIAQTILDKHNAATGDRRFNALLATASINDAIEYFNVFKQLQAKHQSDDPEFEPLRIAVIFSPPAEGNRDIQQIQEDLPQEQEDNRSNPERKKAALKTIIDEYNIQYGENYHIDNFDLYYQDIQQRIKKQQFPNQDSPPEEKIDITIVVDMLLTGFDAKYLNTLYVDKKLKYHGLIQAFSRTNRILNATKPYGHIIDFCQQRHSVDEAIALFSGIQLDQARKIWLVDEAPVVIDRFRQSVGDLSRFMQSQGLKAKPDQINKLRGNVARAQFIKHFKEIQRLGTQLDQYTDLTETQKEQIEQTLCKEDHRAYRGIYLEVTRRLRDQWRKPKKDSEPTNSDLEQIDFELVLFASALIDYDYIMKLIADFSNQDPKKMKISRKQLVELIQSDAKFLDEHEDITEYICLLKEGEGLDESQIHEGYRQFKASKQAKQIDDLAQIYGLPNQSLSNFVNTTLQRMIFDGEMLTELMEPLDLGWRERRDRELALMSDLAPLLKKRANGQIISGLRAYEQVGM